jgi:hypothetical protein
MGRVGRGWIWWKEVGREVERVKRAEGGGKGGEGGGKGREGSEASLLMCHTYRHTSFKAFILPLKEAVCSNLKRKETNFNTTRPMCVHVCACHACVCMCVCVCM